MPKKHRVTYTTYQCSVCRTNYRTQSKAIDCEARPLESPVLRKGDAVRAKEIRTCTNGKNYEVRGHISEVSRPQVPDEEYELKWMGDLARERLKMHVHLYTVTYHCPACKREKMAVYYGPELEPVPACQAQSSKP